MNDLMQRARELLDQSLSARGVLLAAGSEFYAAALGAITAALRAAPEVGDSYIVLQRVDVKRLLAGDENSPGYGLSRRRIAACLDLHNQHGVAVVANGPKVVPPPALGAHEVHPEAVHTGLDLGEAGERLLAADALEHTASVSTDCDGSATAPEGFVLVPVEPTVGLLMSMAIRRDHGLGYPGYYDDPAFGGAGWHQRRLDAALGYARQQHEEVVGHGFYSADREQQYASLAARPQGVRDAT